MRAGHSLGKTTMYEVSGRKGRSEQGYEHRKRTRKDTEVLILRHPVMWEPSQISRVQSLLPHQPPGYPSNMPSPMLLTTLDTSYLTSALQKLFFLKLSIEVLSTHFFNI